MEFPSSLEYLNKLGETKIEFGLERVIKACELLDNPQDSLKIIHIVGTNGKGSTAAFLESILRHSGYRVGLYTSPHLLDVRERVQINRELISKPDFADMIEAVSRLDIKLTYFEVLTLVALLHFKKNNVDLVILEAGLGGRLDATNIGLPLLTIFTQIALDHQNYLGNNIDSIIAEKLAVIKERIPVVASNQENYNLKKIEERCRKLGCMLSIADEGKTLDFKLGLIGKHQATNAATAIVAANKLNDLGYKIQDIEAALSATSWSGRLETISQNPHVIIDCAHNPSAMSFLKDFISGELDTRKIHLMIGIMGDKDIQGMLSPILPYISASYAVAPKIVRACPSDKLAKIINDLGFVGNDAGGVEEALDKLLPLIGENETLIITGSVYTVAEALEYFNKCCHPDPERT
ncbi:bifunctional folylpolyglutamate synthase/dihydrofolate synthase [bacterium]|nr:bifunctional folylpolyglutamate synthase/dihydrofolate synthase [bacterium]